MHESLIAFRKALIDLLDSDEGVSVDGLQSLAAFATWLKDDDGFEATHLFQDLFDAAECQEGRCYIPEDHTFTPEVFPEP